MLEQIGTGAGGAVGDADGGAELHESSQIFDGGGEGGDDAVGHALDFGRRTVVGQQYGKFIAADAGGEGCCGAALAQARCGFLQALVTHGVAVGVVDLLEAIEVHQQQRANFGAAPMAVEIGEPALELATVGQAGHHVIFGEVAMAVGGELFFGDILLHAKEAHWAAATPFDAAGEAHPATIAACGGNFGVEREI